MTTRPDQAVSTIMSWPVATVDHAATTLPLGPQVVLCVEGTVDLTVGERTLQLGSGDSVFLGAADGQGTARGCGRLAVARSPS